ncbi:CsgG/HfaB family protein [Vreelandella rituensis]
MKMYRYSFACCLISLISGCAAIEPNVDTVQPLTGPPVTSNHTPYSQCLADLRDGYEANNLPVIAVGQISDKTGQRTYSTVTESSALTQGVSEMLISAFHKTGKVNLTERLDVRVPLAEQQLFEQNALAFAPQPIAVVPANFVVLGALTELN